MDLGVRMIKQSKSNSSKNKTESELEDSPILKKLKKELMPGSLLSHFEDLNSGSNFMQADGSVCTEKVVGDSAPEHFLVCNEANKLCGRNIAEDSFSSISPQYIKLNSSFYNVSCKELAQNLLGKVLVRSLKHGVVLRGRIVETECYLGGEDKASHSYNGKITPRNKPMYMKPGTTYVYFTYGMYFCFNISSKGDGAAVLIRAVDPIQGHDYMNSQRINKRMNSKKNLKLENSVTKTRISSLKPHELCNGPGKLCISFCIDVKSCNMQDLCTSEEMWIESDNESEKLSCNDLITSTRIGIDSVDAEWALKPLRYYIYGNHSVSRRDKKKEQERLNSFK